MARKPKSNTVPQVNAELKGFDVKINEFGEIISTYNLDQLNDFLDSRVDDKKFRGVEVVKRREADQ